MKVFGIILLVFAVGNLIVAFMAFGMEAPTDAVGSKFASALLLGAVGGLLLYFGSRKKEE